METFFLGGGLQVEEAVERGCQYNRHFSTSPLALLSGWFSELPVKGGFDMDMFPGGYKNNQMFKLP